MINPNLLRLFIRPKEGSTLTLEVSQDRVAWRDTGLSMDTIRADGSGETIGALLARLIQFYNLKDIDEMLPLARQRAIGRQLNRALFGPRAAPVLHRHPHLVPVAPNDPSSDDFFDLFLRMPWALLTETDGPNAEFLALRSVAPACITIDASPRPDGEPLFSQVKLPPCPKILIICPQGDAKTKGKKHIDELIGMIMPEYQSRQLESRIKIVRTYIEFSRALEGDADRFIPHIVYYYGHGEAEQIDTLFHFDPAPGDETGLHRLDDLVDPLSGIYRRSGFPPVIWFNACQGGAARRNTLVRALAPFSSVVIATRQVAAVEDSMALGLRAMRMIALEMVAPPIALSRATADMARDRSDKAVMAARWATTIVAMQYDLWSALDPEGRDGIDAESAGDIPMRLDRRAPLDEIKRHFDDVLERPADGPHVVLWHGLPEDGTEVFAQRFVDFMSEKLEAWSAVHFPVELQLSALPKLGVRHHFRECVYRSMLRGDLSSLVGPVDDDRVSRAVQDLSDGQPTLLVFTHGPFAAEHVAILRDYLAFWRALSSNLGLDSSKTRIVLGLRFVREDTATSLADEGGGFTPIALGEVPGDEITDHIEQFARLYGFDRAEADKAAAELVEGAKGRRFRPLHQALEGTLQLNVWHDRQDQTGGDA